MAFNGKYRVETVTIANGATLSSAVDLDGLGLVGIIMPAAFTGATIGFMVSPDNSTFTDLYTTANTIIAMSVTQGRAYAMQAGDLAGFRYLKIKSASSEGAARTLTLLTREVE